MLRHCQAAHLEMGCQCIGGHRLEGNSAQDGTDRWVGECLKNISLHHGYVLYNQTIANINATTWLRNKLFTNMCHQIHPSTRLW